VAAALVLVLPIMLLHKFGGGIGSDALPAPQAGLMATMADGIISGSMAWELIIIGMFFALALILIQSPAPMLIAVGMYLPFQTTLAIFVGGIIKWALDRVIAKKTGKDKQAAETVGNRGLLVASGLVAGEALVGILLAGIVALNVKFMCPEKFQGEVAQARAFMEKVVPLGEDLAPSDMARKIMADGALMQKLPSLQGLDEKHVASRLVMQKNLATTTCLGTTPESFFKTGIGDWRMWLGFLVILGLGVYMITASMKALGRRGGPASKEATAEEKSPEETDEKKKD